MRPLVKNSALASRANDLVRALLLRPEDDGGPSRLDMMRERESAAELIASLVRENDTLRRTADGVSKWTSMSASEMRLMCGEMTAQEVRSVKAVLKSIMAASKAGSQ